MMHKLNNKIHQVTDKLTHHSQTSTTTGEMTTSPCDTTAPTGGFVETRTAPVTTAVVEKPTVVQETIRPVEKETIQPVVHREREQTEIHKVTQPLHQKEVQPTQVHMGTMAPEVRPTIVERPSEETVRSLNKEAPKSTTNILPSLHSTKVNAPIVEEKVKRNIVEEVQPVLQKEVVQPHVIKEVKPIYEKIVEAPVVVQEQRPVMEMGGKMPLPTATTGCPPVVGGQKQLKVTDVTTTTTTKTENLQS